MAAAADEDYSEEYDEYYDDNEDEGPSGLLILIVGLLIVLVFCLMVVFAYKRGMADGASRAGEVPLVTADAGPVKTERPLDLPAGTRSEVDEALSGNDPAEVLVDTGADDPLNNFDETVSAASQAASRNQPPATTPAQPDNSAGRSDNTAALPTRSGSSSGTNTQPAAQPTTRQPEPAASRPAPRPSPTSLSAISGSHVVQVGAFGSDAEAMQYFNRLESRFPALISGKAADVQRADLGSRGVFHRLRVGPFASSGEATRYCNQLKAGGQDCLVRAVE